MHIKNLLAHKKLFLVSAILFTLIVSIYSLKESEDLPQIALDHLDKVFHVFVYVILTLLWVINVKIYIFKSNEIKNIALVISVLFFYGIIIEVFQEYFTITRTFDVNDLLANIVGIFIGIVLYLQIKNKIIKNN